jgi:hypothetical protein
MLFQKFSKDFTNSVNSSLQEFLKTTLREAKSDFRIANIRTSRPGMSYTFNDMNSEH